MPRPLLPVMLSFLAVAVVAGCGGGGGSSSADTAKPETLLMSLDELPKGSVTAEAAPELCGPIPILEGKGGRVALSKMFVVGQTRLIEAVAAFDTPAEAKSAYEGLNEQKRLDCINSAIDTLSAAASVKTGKPKPIDFGEEGTLVRYLALDGDAKTQGFSDVISLRDGRCTAALLLAVESGDPSESVFEPASETAVDRLSSACE